MTPPRLLPVQVVLGAAARRRSNQPPNAATPAMARPATGGATKRDKSACAPIAAATGTRPAPATAPAAAPSHGNPRAHANEPSIADAARQATPRPPSQAQRRSAYSESPGRRGFS